MCTVGYDFVVVSFVRPFTEDLFVPLVAEVKIVFHFGASGPIEPDVYRGICRGDTDITSFPLAAKFFDIVGEGRGFKDLAGGGGGEDSAEVAVVVFNDVDVEGGIRAEEGAGGGGGGDDATFECGDS